MFLTQLLPKLTAHCIASLGDIDLEKGSNTSPYRYFHTVQPVELLFRCPSTSAHSSIFRDRHPYRGIFVRRLTKPLRPSCSGFLCLARVVAFRGSRVCLSLASKYASKQVRALGEATCYSMSWHSRGNGAQMRLAQSQKSSSCRAAAHWTRRKEDFPIRKKANSERLNRFSHLLLPLLFPLVFFSQTFSSSSPLASQNNHPVASGFPS